MSHYDIAAYIWPSYHYEPRAEQFWPEKDGEWYTVRRGTPRFSGHDMPKIPILGYQDEADPEIMKQHIDLGATYGVNTFIMDWYWYEDAPCFERQLDDGLMPALMGTDSRFYIMWANHDANTVWNMHTDAHDLVWQGTVDRKIFEGMADRIIDKYLFHPNYYRISDRPVFCIYFVANLVAGLGGVDQTKETLEWMRMRAVSKGLPGLHLQAIQMKGKPADIYSDVADFDSVGVAQMIQHLGFDSVTHYQYVHEAGGTGEYLSWADQATRGWDKHSEDYPLYFPHVSIGWDNTQRVPSQVDIVRGSSPENFEMYLKRAKAYLDKRPEQPQLVTINSWNEWTEGSYLLPDETWGYGYLEAVNRVFGSAACS